MSICDIEAIEGCQQLLISSRRVEMFVDCGAVPDVPWLGMTPSWMTGEVHHANLAMTCAKYSLLRGLSRYAS
jgi:hypothetical protein